MNRIRSSSRNGKAFEVARQALRAALALLEAVEEEPAEEPPDAGVELVDAKKNPLGSAWTFRRLAKEGAFPSFKLGRRVVAKRADVLAYVEAQRITPKAPAANDLDEWDAQMEADHG